MRARCARGGQRNLSATRTETAAHIQSAGEEAEPGLSQQRAPAIVSPSNETLAAHYADNVEYGQLMRDCHQLEKDWRDRHLQLGAGVRTIWMEAPESGEPLHKRSDETLMQMEAQAEYWRANTSLSLGGRNLTLSSIIRFHRMPTPSPDGPNVCWSLEPTLETEGRTLSLGGSGGCGVFEFNANDEPVATILSYEKKEVGDLVSAFVFPLDVASHKPLRFLPATGTEEWSEVDLNYEPISQTEYAEGVTRLPASEHK